MTLSAKGKSTGVTLNWSFPTRNEPKEERGPCLLVGTAFQDVETLVKVRNPCTPLGMRIFGTNFEQKASGMLDKCCTADPLFEVSRYVSQGCFCLPSVGLKPGNKSWRIRNTRPAGLSLNDPVPRGANQNCKLGMVAS